jgi:hypothetical protein
MRQTRRRRLLVFAIPALVLGFAGTARATTYYVSPTGSNLNSGTTTSAPWKTIGRADSATLLPGDTVRFQGGQTFSDSVLIPPASGTQAAPITFNSYGTGRARLTQPGNTIWTDAGMHDLAFKNIELDGQGMGTNVFQSTSAGIRARRFTISNCYIHNSSGVGLISPNPGDANWVIDGNTFSHFGDSSVIVEGIGFQVTHNTIADMGWNTGIKYGKHGIYDDGPDTTIAYNDVGASPALNGQAISIRFHGARVYGNTIHDVPGAFGFFDYDTAAAPQGTSYVYDNRAWNVTNYAFYYSSQTDPQGLPPSVNFVIASNTFVLLVGGTVVNVDSGMTSATVTLANNVFTGSYGAGLTGSPTTTESYDLWFGGGLAIPQDQGDVYADPQLSAPPALAPGASSPGNDTGTGSVPGLTYTAGCDGAPLHYCNNGPDIGAVEFLGTIVPSPPVNTTPPSFSPTDQAGGLRVGLAVGKASDGVWSGTAPIAYGYQWQACTTNAASSCSNILGATSTSFVLQPAQQGLFIRLAVTGTNSYGQATAYSALSTDPVGVAAAPPVNTAAPTFSPTTAAGGLQAGGTVTKTSDGGWTGTLPIGFTYQWQQCKTTDPASCVNMSGATSSSYVLKPGQKGQYIRLAVTGVNLYGQVTAYSAASTDPVAKH